MYDSQEPRGGRLEVDRRFVEEHTPWMFSLAQKILGDPGLAEDAVQEALLTAHDKGDSFEGRASIRTWLYRVTVNAALAVRQKQSRNVADVDALQPDFDSNACRIEAPWVELKTTEDVLEQDDLSAFVRRCVDSLPDPYRICLQLKDFEELSVADVASILDISETNVKVRTHRARSALKKLLEPLLRGRPLSEIMEGPVPADLSPSPMRRAKGLMLATMPLMITCEQFEAFIADYLEGSLPRRQHRLFEFHIRTCRECRDYLAAYERARQIASATAPAPTDAPPDLVDAVVRSLGT